MLKRLTGSFLVCVSGDEFQRRISPAHTAVRQVSPAHIITSAQKRAVLFVLVLKFWTQNHCGTKTTRLFVVVLMSERFPAVRRALSDLYVHGVPPRLRCGNLSASSFLCPHQRCSAGRRQRGEKPSRTHRAPRASVACLVRSVSHQCETQLTLALIDEL